MRLLSRAIVITAAAALAAPSAARAQTFDVGADFSLSNPSGVWTYGSKLTPLGAFTAYPLAGTTAGTIQYHTSNVGGDLTPGVFHNTGPALTSGTVNFLAGETGFHPGPNGEISVFRFTAPTAGSYTLASNFYGLDVTGQTNTNVSIVLPGVPLTIGVGNVTGFRGPGLTYNGVFALNAGDVIDFQVDPNGAYVYDMTAIDAQLRLSAVPEPATVALVAGGLLALGGVARRKRRGRER